MKQKVELISLLFVLFYAVMLLADEEVSDPTECPSDLSSSAKSDCCASLDARKANFSECCNYPRMVIHKWKYDECMDSCGNFTTNFTSCCFYECALRYLKMIGNTTEDHEINIEGIKYSFMLSVANETEVGWNDVVSDAVNTCNEKYFIKIPDDTNTIDDFWYCNDTIPNYLFDIFGCSYDAIFLKCPNYKYDVQGCNLTQAFVKDCLVHEIV